jgi:hypothetical protein
MLELLLERNMLDFRSWRMRGTEESMRNSLRRIMGVASVVFALSCPIGPASATQLSGSLVTTGLQGLHGFLYFDFIGFVPPGPDNFATLDFPFGGDGMVNGTSTTGDVTGSGPWTLRLVAAFFSEVAVDYTFGTLFTFSFTTSDLVPPPDSPQAFSLSAAYIDPVTGDPVPLDTGDLCGGALFSYSIGQGQDALQICQPINVSDVSISVSQAPEPSPLALLAVAFLAVAWQRMISSAAARARCWLVRAASGAKAAIVSLP